MAKVKSESKAVVVKVDPKIEEVDKKIKAIAKVEYKALKTQDEYDQVATKLLQIKEFKKRIEEVFKPMLTAAKATVKAIDGEYKKHLDPVAAIDEKLRMLAAAWNMEQERKREAEQAKLDAKREAKIEKLAAKNEEREAKGLAPKDDFVPVVQAAAVEKAGLSFRTVYRFEIEDASKVPKKYWVIDETAIGAEVRAAKGQIEIAGVKVIIEKVPMI